MTPAIVTGTVILFVGLGLTFTNASPDMVLLGGLAVLVVSGVLTPERALEGFANEGVATIAALFVVAEGLRRTGALSFVATHVLRPARSPAHAQLQAMAPVAAMSAFMNNTPVVAMMMPVVRAWTRRSRIPDSLILLPLSYASIFGGLLTLVGTSTTLVVNGLLLSTAGQRGFGMFELAWVGLPISVACIAAIPILGRWLLPARRPVIDERDDPREYTLEMLVTDPSPLSGRTVREAGLRRLPGVFLIELSRGGHIFPAVGPDTRLLAGDRLVFAGLVDSVVELHAMPGLAPAMEPRFKLDPPRAPRSLVEVVVSTAAPFIGVTVREARFRTRYQAAIIAVARHGARIHEKPGDIRLAPGDTLLLEASSSFLDLHRDAPEFFVVRQIDDPSVTPTKRAWASRGILGGMVAVVALELMTMFEAACLAGILMVGARCVRLSQARAAIDWTVIIGVAAGIGLGAALEETGAARLLATAAVHLLGDQPYANLLGVSVATMLLANLVTTKAAALLMYPVALAIAERLDVDFMPFAVALVISAACALATPVGYQTNLMVYGPGGYRGADFLRMGGALSMIVLSLLAWLVPAIWPFAPI